MVFPFSFRFLSGVAVFALLFPASPVLAEEERLMNLFPKQRASHAATMDEYAAHYQQRGQVYVDHLYDTGGEEELAPDSLLTEIQAETIEPVPIDTGEVADIVKQAEAKGLVPSDVPVSDPVQEPAPEKKAETEDQETAPELKTEEQNTKQGTEQGEVVLPQPEDSVPSLLAPPGEGEQGGQDSGAAVAPLSSEKTLEDVPTPSTAGAVPVTPLPSAVEGAKPEEKKDF